MFTVKNEGKIILFQWVDCIALKIIFYKNLSKFGLIFHVRKKNILFIDSCYIANVEGILTTVGNPQSVSQLLLVQRELFSCLSAVVRVEIYSYY